MKTCSVDLDGVLNYYPQCWVDYINQELGTAFVTKEEAMHTLGQDRYDLLKHQYRLSDFKANLNLDEENVQLLRTLKQAGYFIVIATDRPFSKYPNMHSMTEEWLKKNNVPYDELISKRELANICVDFHVDDEPFFTVCIETYNRGKTIFNTLISVALQTFRNFDVVIIDNKSTDNTVSEIRRFFLSDTFKQHPFRHIVRQNKTCLSHLRNWNEPLKLARGKYIATLEGDDQYAPNHLEEAYRMIMLHPNLGIYTVNNHADSSFVETYLIKDVASPSELVFIREHADKPYLFDVTHYGFCPEVALQLDILKDGYEAVHNSNHQVFRYPSNHESPLTRFIDYFRIAFRYKQYVSQRKYYTAFALNFKRFFQYITVFPFRYRELKKTSEGLRGYSNFPLFSIFKHRHFASSSIARQQTADARKTRGE